MTESGVTAVVSVRVETSGYGKEHATPACLSDFTSTLCSLVFERRLRDGRPLVFVRHLHRSTFNPSYDNTPMFLIGMIGFPLAAIPIVLGSRVRSVAGGHRPGDTPHYRTSARVLGLFSLGTLAAVVLFYVALKMLGLPDHPF